MHVLSVKVEETDVSPNSTPDEASVQLPVQAEGYEAVAHARGGTMEGLLKRDKRFRSWLDNQSVCSKK